MAANTFSICAVKAATSSAVAVLSVTFLRAAAIISVSLSVSVFTDSMVLYGESVAEITGNIWNSPMANDGPPPAIGLLLLVETTLKRM